MRVVVVGAGVAGLTCARTLQGAGVDVVVLERGRTVGGRLASRRDPDGRWWDHGASYFTATDDFVRDVPGARPWATRFRSEEHEGPQRWVGVPCQRAVAEAWAEDLAVRLETEVASASGTGVHLLDGRTIRADAVVLAMPDPQVARLVPWTSTPWKARVVLAARLPERTWDFDGWFVNDHPVISWIADDGSRRGDGEPVLVAHARPDWSAAHLLDVAAHKPELVAALAELVPGEPSWTYVHRWSFAAPSEGRDASFWLQDGVGICGDGWGPTSRVQTAWESGRALAQALLSR